MLFERALADGLELTNINSNVGKSREQLRWLLHWLAHSNGQLSLGVIDRLLRLDPPEPKRPTVIEDITNGKFSR